MKKSRLDCVGVADVFFNSCDIQPDIISMHCCCQDSEERNINISMCTSRGHNMEPFKGNLDTVSEEETCSFL